MKQKDKVLIASFNLGAVRNMLNVDKKNEWQRLEKFLSKVPTPKKIIGIGGNIRSFLDAHNVESMSSKQFQKCSVKMARLTYKDKMKEFNFSDDRADVIDYAMEIFSFILMHSSCNKIKATKWGVSDSIACLLYTSPSPRDATLSRMPSSA